MSNQNSLAVYEPPMAKYSLAVYEPMAKYSLPKIQTPRNSNERPRKRTAKRLETYYVESHGKVRKLYYRDDDNTPIDILN